MRKVCDRCGQSTFDFIEDGRCRCKQYEYRIDNWHGDEDWEQKYFRGDEEDLAEDVAEEFYGEDPCNPNNFEAVVHVRLADSPEKTKTFTVTAEATVNFYAREKE